MSKEKKLDKKRVFILQDTYESCKEEEKVVEGDDEFFVAGSFTDGIAALSAVLDKKPDFLITSLVVSGYDGLRIIEKIRDAGLKTSVIVLSALCREEIISKAVNAGAAYFMAKPVNGAMLKSRMKEIACGATDNVSVQSVGAGLHTTSLDEKISKIFINVGIPPHIKGYSFLREGVKMAVEDPAIINSITKRLYPMIGEKYATSASKVERAIRHAIEVAWNRGRIDSINGILGVRAYVGAEKPTNGEFIALVADKMLLERS